MKRRVSQLTGVIAGLFAMGFATEAFASSHREAPAIAADPSADNTDNYAWVDANGNLVVIADFIGLEIPEGGPNWARFSDDVLYEIHLTRGDSLKDAITYQFQFTTAPVGYVKQNVGMQPTQLQSVPAKGLEFFAQLSGGGAFNQMYTVTKVVNGSATNLGTFKVPPPNVGPTTDQVAYNFTIASGDNYEKHWIDTAATSTIGMLSNGEGRVFAGPRDDPFYVDLGAIFDLAQPRPVLQSLQGGKNLGAGAGSQQLCNPTCTPRDSLAFTNVHAIALEIPGIVANGGTAVTTGASKAQTIGVWSSASRRKVSVLRKDGTTDTYGPWRQVSRLGIPLINETVIGLQDKDYWNGSTPQDDAPIFGAYFDNLIAARDAQAVGYYASTLSFCKIQNGGPPLTNRLADIIPVINLKAVNQVYNFTTIGDVLRVDLGTPMSDFPNGRRLVGGANYESVDVVDTEVKMLFCTLGNPTVDANLKPNQFNLHTPYGGIPDGVDTNETNYRSTFPYLAAPWQAWSATPRGGANPN